MEREPYKPLELEYGDKVFQDLKKNLMKFYFMPMLYEPTLADWATIKNLRNIHYKLKNNWVKK